jgi:hypothetical protein
MRSPRCGPDTRSSPARPAASTPLERLSHATTWSSGGGAVAACARGSRARCRVGRSPHDTVARPARRCAAQVAGQAEAEARPGSRCSVFLVCDYTCSSAARSRSSAAWSRHRRGGRSSAARSHASALPGRRQGPPRAGPARPGPRATPPPPARPAPQPPAPCVVHGKAGDPRTLGLLDNLLGEVGHPPRGCLVSSRLR